MAHTVRTAVAIRRSKVMSNHSTGAHPRGEGRVANLRTVKDGYGRLNSTR